MEPNNLTPLFEVFDRLGIFLGRREVQIQLVAALIALAAAQFVSHLLWQFLHRHGLVTPIVIPEPASVRRSSLTFIRALLRLLRPMTFPLLGIGALLLTGRIMGWAGQLSGLVSGLSSALGVLLAFRALLGLLSAFFNPAKVRLYQTRLFAPLTVVVIFLTLLGNIVDLQDLADLVIVRLGNPVTLGAVLLATIGLYFWIMIVAGLKDVLHHIMVTRFNTDTGSAEATLTLLRYMLIIVGVAFALSQLQLDSTTVAAITAGLSVGIGFGLQEVLSNLVSGILILTEKSIRPGDVIEFNGGVVTVSNVSIRATRVRTSLDTEIVIPNRSFLTAPFTTYTGTDKLVRVQVPVVVSYKNDPQKVVQVLLGVARANKDVLSNPAPAVNVAGYAVNTINFNLIVAVNEPLIMNRVRSDLYNAIWDAFTENNISVS